MRNNRALAVLAALALASAAGWPLAAFGEASATAADAAPRVDVVPTAAAKQAANELMRLQEDTLILKAQLKKLDAQAQVVERQETLHRMGSTVSTYSDVGVVAPPSTGQRSTKTVAGCLAVSFVTKKILGKGPGRRGTKTNGAEFDVATGDTLPNGMRVAAIRSGAIVLTAADGHRTTLTVSASVRDPARNVAQAGAGAVPPIPTYPMPAR